MHDLRGAVMAAALAAVVFFGILTLWIPDRWAFGAVQLALFGLAAAWLTRRPISFHPLMVPLAGAAAWAAVQLLAGWSIYRWATRDAGLTWLAWLVCFWLAWQILASDEARARFLRWLAFFGGAVSVVALFQRFTVVANGLPAGQMGPFVYENQFAAFVQLVLPLVLVAALDPRKVRYGYAAVAAAMIVSVFLSGSVAGSFLVLAETAVVLRLAPGARRLSRVAVLAGLALLFTAVTGWQLLHLKLLREEPYRARSHLVSSSLEMVRDRPWTGFGLGTWSAAYPAYARFDDGLFDNQAHNDWVQWAAEGGIPLFLLMVWMASMLFAPAVRSVWGIGLLFVLVHCLVDYHFQQRPAFGCLYFAMAGAVIRAAASGSRSVPVPAPARSAPGSSSR